MNENQERAVKKQYYGISLFGAAILASIAFLSADNSNAQSTPSWNVSLPGQNNAVTQNADDCANLCSQTALCASYIYKPFTGAQEHQTGGQCRFSRSSSPPNETGAIVGRPARNRITENVPTGPAIRSNPNASNGGNYSVAPITQTAPVRQMANNPTPAPQSNVNNNGAAISFERRSAPSTPAQAPRPVQQTTPATPATHAQPAASSNQVNAATPSRATANSSHRPSPAPAQAVAPARTAANNHMATNAQPAPAHPVAPAPVHPVAAAPTQPVQTANNASGIDRFRGPDGMIDAAEMRRAQLHSQQAQNTPQYSVQYQWQPAADAQLTGSDLDGIDLTKTRPVPMPEPARRSNNNHNSDDENSSNNTSSSTNESANTQSRNPLQRLFSRDDTQTSVAQNNNGSSFGPLRKRAE